MACHVPGCLGNYDFDHIAAFAKKRFIDGCDTVQLLQQAHSQCEKEEIVLVSLLDVEDDQIRDIRAHLPSHAVHDHGLPGTAEKDDRRSARRTLAQRLLQFSVHAS